MWIEKEREVTYPLNIKLTFQKLLHTSLMKTEEVVCNRVYSLTQFTPNTFPQFLGVIHYLGISPYKNINFNIILITKLCFKNDFNIYSSLFRDRKFLTHMANWRTVTCFSLMVLWRMNCRIHMIWLVSLKVVKRL